MTASDNPNNTDGKALRSQRWDLELRGYVDKTDTQVSADHTMEIPMNFPIADEQVINERNIHKARRIEELLTPTTVTDKYLGTAWEQLQRFAVSWTVTKDMISSSAVPTGGFYVVVGENREHNPANYKRDVYTVSAWQSLTSYEYDDDLGVLLTVVESVVSHGTAMPTPTATVGYQQRQVDANRDILTSYTLPGAWSRTSYESQQYTWPALLAVWDGETNPTAATDADIVIGTSFEEANARTVFYLTVPLRDSFTEMTKLTVVEEIITAATATTLNGVGAENTAGFGTTTDLGSSSGTIKRARLWNPRPRDHNYSGLMVEYRVANVLNDEITLSFTSNGDDTYYGAVSESFTLPRTNISATEYIALIGSTVCVEDSIAQWKYGLWKRRRVYVVVQ